MRSRHRVEAALHCNHNHGLVGRGSIGQTVLSVVLGLGHILALHYRSPTSYQVYLLRDSVPLFLKRQCDRALGRAGFRRLRVRRRADTRRGCRTVRTLRILSWMHIFYCRKCLKVGLVIHFFGREHTVPTF
jgi:hypothetical protein